ncbi:hypothetical protein IT568_04425 [bacterium]|nr:hypothetical protein [bacterium]
MENEFTFTFETLQHKIPNCKVVHSTKELDYFKSPSRIFVRFNKDESYSEISQNSCKFYVGDYLKSYPKILIDWLFEPSFLEIIRQRGIYFLHAGACVKNGKTVIFPASSGSGKTTLTMTLLKGGFSLLSDDKVFFKKDSNSCFSFATPLKVTEEAFKFLELKGDYNTSYQGKILIPRENLQTVDSGIPKVFLFLKLTQGKSKLEKIDKTSAFMKLLSPSLTLCNPEAVKIQLAVMKKILLVSECYNLHFGQDFEDVPKNISALL